MINESSKGYLDKLNKSNIRNLSDFNKKKNLKILIKLIREDIDNIQSLSDCFRVYNEINEFIDRVNMKEFSRKYPELRKFLVKLFNQYISNINTRKYR